ncbi:hypothetical protein IJ843_02105, partial [bacterium]|nr:hypothetical protein [bacterium]
APQIHPHDPQMHPQAPHLQPQVPQMHPHEPQMPPQVPQMQSQAPQVQPQAPQMQPQAPQVQPQAPQVQPQVPQMQPQVPQVQPQAPQMPPQAPQMQPQAPQVQPQVPQMQPQAPQVQPQAPQMQPQVPQMQPQVPQMQPQVPQMQPQVPQMQPQVPQMQPQVPQMPPQAPQMPPQAPQMPPQAPQMQPQVPQMPPQAPQMPPQVPQVQPQVPQVQPHVPHVQQQVPQQIQNHNPNNVNIVRDNPMQFQPQNRPENIINNTSQQIHNQALNSPHQQLYQTIRNHVRQPIIQQPPPKMPDIAEEMQLNSQKTQGMTAEELAKFKQNLASQLNSNVNLTHVSALLQRNSKMAMNKMVSMMTMATAQGMTDIKPLQDTVNIINASVSANSQNDATMTLKNLMLLYLPWLPLQEGVGFDLEIEQDDEVPESDTYIKILITTVNFGNLHATVSLITGNSVDISIICSEKFPKKELFKRLMKDGTQHSMQTAIDIKEQKPQEQLETINPKAKVNLSNVNQVNPYLLLMSHAIIRHTIELDATISIGSQPIDD